MDLPIWCSVGCKESNLYSAGLGWPLHNFVLLDGTSFRGFLEVQSHMIPQTIAIIIVPWHTVLSYRLKEDDFSLEFYSSTIVDGSYCFSGLHINWAMGFV